MEDLKINYKTIVNNCIIDLIYGVDDIVLPHHKLNDDLGIDSLDVVELSMNLEIAFDIDLKESCENWDIVQDVYVCVLKLLEEKLS